MSDRERILDAVQEMPETASFHEILDELRLMDTVRERLEKNPRGQGVPAEELLRQVSSWVTK
jgi:predicted transcriptional regulator